MLEYAEELEDLEVVYAGLIAYKNSLIPSDYDIDVARHSTWWPVYAGTGVFDYGADMIDHHGCYY